MNLLLENISKSEQKLAHLAIQALEESISKAVTDKKETVELQLSEGKNVVIIPLKAFNIFKFIIDNMAEGNAVRVMNNDRELTTQEAADLLHISRPYLVKLLEQGDIPFRKVGTHRRVLLSDVMAYDEKFKQKQLENMALLAKQAQELNLGYE